MNFEIDNKYSNYKMPQKIQVFRINHEKSNNTV